MCHLKTKRTAKLLCVLGNHIACGSVGIILRFSCLISEMKSYVDSVDNWDFECVLK